MFGRRFAVACVVAVVGAVALGSCASGIRVYVNPEADMAYYTKIAVLPFTNVSTDGLAGQRVTRSFVTELIMTNRYEIVQPEDFRGILQRIAGAPGADGSYDPAKVREAALAAGATGILRGGVTEYTSQRSESGDVPMISFDAELVDVNTGGVVWRSAISKRGKGSVPLFGGGTRSLGRLTQQACVELVSRLRREAL